MSHVAQHVRRLIVIFGVLVQNRLWFRDASLNALLPLHLHILDNNCSVVESGDSRPIGIQLCRTNRGNSLFFSEIKFKQNQTSDCKMQEEIFKKSLNQSFK